ncbi:hypothetical protein UA08_01382 [Talaromyces atroroseus]|uniref:GAR domain-containing protein n=1 Tax=Talaromyces atroroseus TaxID=1441469 RepID=A0A1Q5Q9S1_TALAT|nr:hypothetical protein UA08_01382 [Talaromyces atroroseus]OKL62641.1 hypothetical protein UA08_01382 [Talaromyces atroroseus]
MAESLSYSLHAVRVPVPPSPHSPLRSPKRRQQLPVEDDPLLARLSPEAILDALAAINAVSKHERQAKDLLTKSISQVSPEDRALGARAAIAAKKLREWLKELQAWQWPKGLSIQQGKGFEPPSTNGSSAQVEFWGSLPASLVGEYEARIEEIHDGMDSLNVDELKEHIMNVHVPGRSRPSSAHSALSSISAPPFTHTQLSDFTAVITATILRALPTLARLNVLLDTWNARLLVLRQIPELLDSINAARASLDFAIAMLSTENPLHNTRPPILDVTSKKEELVQVIGVAGSRMDTVLDALEGREDSIPEIWIDNMDRLEADFATWVQQAEKLAIEREWRTNTEEPAKSAVEDLELQRDVSTNHQVPNSAREHDCETPIESSPSPSVEKSLYPSFEVNTNIQHTSSSSEGKRVLPSGSFVNPPITAQGIALTSIPENEEVPKPVTPDYSPAFEPKRPQMSQSLPTESLLATSSDTTEIAGDIPIPNSSISVADSNSKHEQAANETPSHSNREDTVPMEENLDALKTNKKLDPGKTEPQLDKGKPDLCNVELSKSPSVIGNRASSYVPEKQSDTTILTPEHDANSPEDAFRPKFSTEEHSVLEESLPTINADSSLVPEIDNFGPPREEADDLDLGDEVKKGKEELDAGGHVPGSENIPQQRPIVQPAHGSNDMDAEVLEKMRRETGADELGTGNSVLELKDNQSSPRLLHPEGPKPTSAMSHVQEGVNVKETSEDRLEDSPAGEVTADRQINPSSKPSPPLDPDVPVQSIESDVDHNIPTDPMPPSFTRTVSGGPPAQDPTVHFSPRLFSSASDRTIRGIGSPQLSSSVLHDLQSFQHTKNASLPLQRFIDDETDVNYSINHDMHSDSSSSREELSDSPRYFRENSEIPRFRNRSESPPPNVVPRRAVRGPSSSLMRGTISSLNKVVGTTNNETTSERLHSRHRLGSPYDVDDSDSTPWRRKSSTKGFLQAPSHHLQNQPSMESIGSYGSSNGTGRRRYSFSTDGGSFAIRPVNEADSDLQEKIHTILTGIPGKIRLSNKPASDYDQQSVISSISSTKRNRIQARSPFSTPSRAGTPAPSEGFPSSSKQRRTTSHKSEDKTVRVYHLHHRGKTEPTKLFVRTVGEDGERVMVRVGGGWADLGEYLREYVLHHGRQTPSNSNVEVKDLSATANSPGSTTSTATAVAMPSSPDHPSTMCDRPASSLSVRKTRRISRPSELPELAIDSVETVADNLPLPSFPSGRRTSVSSLNSVSVTSILGDGSSVYSPHPGSARTPHSVSTPLGLAGPKPRSRHVSMTPESEAWVEDVIGQARRTSSIVKPTQRHSDHHLMNRDVLNSSRMGTRSVSDLASVGRSKRVILKGLESQDRS